MITSKSKNIQDIFSKLPALAASSANILIIGESGTGKEVLAKMIHSASARSEKEMISVNCAAIPENLLESELFGHKKGAFTGAISDHKGLFEQADGSTIFLDEIGDLPLSLQAKLLRVLQERTLRPIGSVVEKKVNFKLIAATHHDLKTEVEKGVFREDLYYRLSVLPLALPPLRHRKEDIPNLVHKFLKHFSNVNGVPQSLGISAVAMSELVGRRWPGNIRELENLIEQVVVLNRDKTVIEYKNLPRESQRVSDSTISTMHKKFDSFPTVCELTNEYIEYVLKQVGLHQGEAARILGLSRRTIYRKIKSQAV